MTSRWSGRYREREFWLLAAIWLIWMAADTYVNISSELAEMRARGDLTPAWEPITWEVSSHAVILALIPAVYWVVRRFPPTGARWFRNLACHAGFAIGFSVIHVVAMVAVRKLIYALMGRVYEIGPWLAGFFYELRKDLLAYALFVLLIYALRALFDRHGQNDPVEPERLALASDKGQILIARDDIRWLEAAGNYVVVHGRHQRFETRSSLAGLLHRLDDPDLLRIHRRHAVRVTAIRAVRPAASGDAVVTLDDGTALRVSRRFRAAIDAWIAGGQSVSRAKATT